VSLGEDDSNGERLMTDYRINGHVDGHTWFRGRYILLGGDVEKKMLLDKFICCYILLSPPGWGGV
jgi:hypothetical protein